MRIIALADLHGSISQIQAISPELAGADIVLLAGDITNFGGRKEAERVIGAVAAWNADILAVAGNCDTLDVAQYLRDRHLNADACHVREGVAIVGIGGSLPCPGTTPNEINEDGFRLALAAAYTNVGIGRPSVLLSHQPPYGTKVDLANREMHVGSGAVRNAIEYYKPLICFTGHIHEAVGVDTIGETIVINPGPLRQGRFALAEIVDGKVIECTVASATGG